MLEGGYVLFLVFRGDNTTPVFKKEFSPLHNRCLVLLSKLLKDGSEGYWDNLYPSLDVAQEVAKGGTYQAKVPAGPRVGEMETITVPKTGTCGTARTLAVSAAALHTTPHGASRPPDAAASRPTPFVSLALAGFCSPPTVARSWSWASHPSSPQVTMLPPVHAAPAPRASRADAPTRRRRLSLSGTLTSRQAS